MSVCVCVRFFVYKLVIGGLRVTQRGGLEGGQLPVNVCVCAFFCVCVCVRFFVFNRVIFARDTERRAGGGQLPVCVCVCAFLCVFVCVSVLLCISL